MVVSRFSQDWSRTCSFCTTTLLSTEEDGWCCNQGRKRLPRLPACDDLLDSMLDLYQGRVSQMSRRLNNLFAFSAIGTTGRFVPFQGLANVVLEGRVYHRLLDVSEKGHSMHWFLYDEAARAERARELSVAEDAVNTVRQFLEHVNPYVRTLRHVLAQNKIPANFMGSRAWASDQVTDSLAIARKLGKPSIWLTMTTNPQWSEIQSQLLPGQDVTDIPAVVCRAFRARLGALKAFLRKRSGGLVYEISVVEFQKRGLPHAHIVVKFKQEPPLSALDIFISAELPDADHEPDLYRQVRRFHMHSQNHLARPGSRCNRNGRCIYSYPQPITPHTHLDDLGRVHYRRRKAESCWVTPHIPALLKLLDCHIYVDICSTAVIFLYLFKYLFKGPDRTRFSLRNMVDPGDEEDIINEYKDYVSARYLSASEAVYRIFNFGTVHKSPSVRCLPVHLEGRNLASMRRPTAPGFSTMSDLLWYFQRPPTEPFQQLTYMEFFSCYYFETLPLDDPLDRGQVLITEVETNQGLRQKVTIPLRYKEQFYLRALLQVRPASSFQDLRTVHGHCYETYHEAASALGLFQDASEAEYAISEAIAAYSRPSQLRFLFAYLLLDLPFPAMQLWTRFQRDLCADYGLHHHTDDATNLALEDIARYLSSQGSSLTQCGLPEPQRHHYGSECSAPVLTPPVQG
ncbi:hypothetical protein CNMCM6106_008742 [Aspergillus hiratsukae]|uniref:Helitron helicase-like domain-containing protein n=1 Tax=Aspergillus hiratsukae TaxID=1194566 RepID=A0A8H6QKN0_9EURO|nr:hypothetical protein CNMCM6106_008742 [Aspergillus hiratsukae]